MARRILNGDDVLAMFAHLAGLDREVVAFGYLGGDGVLLAVRHCLTGSGPTAAQAPLRAVARDAIMLGAARVVMAHNHPSGDPTPSQADRAVTRRIAAALAALGAPLVEHLVLARSGHRSFGAAGLV